MSNFRFHVGMLALVAVLGGTVLLHQTGILTAAVAPADANLKPACEWDPALFPLLASEELEVMTVSQAWSNLYHDAVRTVIAVHQADPGPSLSCTEEPIRYASAALQSLASTLEPWKQWSPDDLPYLPEAAMGSVLLEYARVYECSLRQRWFLLPTSAITELSGINALTGDGPTEAGAVRVSSQVARVEQEQRLIQAELAVARPALHRTLSAIAGSERFVSLSGSMECLARTSADISNQMGLAATVSACLPSRAWDANGSYLDLPRE